MTTIPPFQIGFLNLWICTILLFAQPILISIFTGSGWKRALTTPEMFAGEKIIYYIWIGIQPIIYIYSIFVPFVFKSMWFYPGLIILLSGTIIMGLGAFAYQSSPDDSLITKGIYKISRNPDYFGSFLCYAGMGLVGAAWPILILAILHFIFYQITAQYEERMCAKLWPAEFTEYKKKTAKNFLFF